MPLRTNPYPPGLRRYMATDQAILMRLHGNGAGRHNYGGTSNSVYFWINRWRSNKELDWPYLYVHMINNEDCKEMASILEAVDDR